MPYLCYLIAAIQIPLQIPDFPSTLIHSALSCSEFKIPRKRIWINKIIIFTAHIKLLF